jgi:hypothetical protein
MFEPRGRYAVSRNFNAGRSQLCRRKNSEQALRKTLKIARAHSALRFFSHRRRCGFHRRSTTRTNFSDVCKFQKSLTASATLIALRDLFFAI